MRKMKAEVGNVGVRLVLNRVDWDVVTCLFADDTIVKVVSPFICISNCPPWCGKITILGSGT